MSILNYMLKILPEVGETLPVLNSWCWGLVHCVYCTNTDWSTLCLCCSHCFGSILNSEILFRLYTFAVPRCYNNYKRKRVIGGHQVGLVDE